MANWHAWGIMIGLLASGAPAASAQEQTGEQVSQDEASFLGTGGTSSEGAASTGGETAGAGEVTEPGGPADTGWLSGQGSGPAAADTVASPTEDPDALLREDPELAYHSIGFRSGAIFVPDFLIKAFGLAESPGVIGPYAGIEYTFRRNGLDIVPAVWWGGYEGGGPVREDGDPLSETESITSDINMIWITVDFLPSYDFTDYLAIYYGGGIGFGITTGGVVRNEMYLQNGTWHDCNGPADPPEQVSYCELDGGHYHYQVPQEFKGVWPVYPQLDGRLGLRWKPLRNLVIAAPDFAFGLPSLFTIGGRIAYLF